MHVYIFIVGGKSSIFISLIIYHLSVHMQMNQEIQYWLFKSQAYMPKPSFVAQLTFLEKF